MLAVIILAAGESRRMGQPKALLTFPETFSFESAREVRSRPAAQAAGEPRLAPTKTKSTPNAGRFGFAQRKSEGAADTKPKTFLEHLIEVTRHPRVGVLRIVVGAHAAEIRARVKLPDGAVVVNENWEKGQLSSLQAAIRSLPAGETEGMLVCLVDHPLISAPLVSTLIEAFERAKNKIVIPTYRGRRGHPVIFPRALYAELLALPENTPESARENTLKNIGARAVVRAHAADVLEIPVEEEGIVLNLNDPSTLERFTQD
ncbi:MAG: nucleotidyltransferase family protein [Candidatus Acidiferrales bacterium]